MKRPRLALSLPPGHTGPTLVLGPIWLAMLPAVYVVAFLAAPLVAPALMPAQIGVVGVAVTVLLLGVAILHVQSHVWFACSAQQPTPHILALDVAGDATQAWQTSERVAVDLLGALAGPLTNLVVGIAALLIWNLQVHPVANVIALFVGLTSGALAVLNLAPAWPLDGGRVAHILLSRLIGARRARQVVMGLSAIVWLALAAWGAYLGTLGARFSVEVGTATFVVAVVLLAGLRHRPAPLPAPAVVRQPGVLRRIAGWPATIALLLVLLGGSLSIVPRLDGLYSPGPAVSVEPMVVVPPERRSTSQGELLLTTVVAQTPITLGQWLYARSNPAFLLVPPERVVPRDISPQQLVQQNFSMLEESEATAIVVGMRLAGYQADLTTTAVAIASVAPESPSAGLLEPGDVIVSAGGIATPSGDVLRQELAKHAPGDEVQLGLTRQGRPITVMATLMDPAQAGGLPRIGVSLQNIGLDIELDFPVSITTQKIVGGPSAGLMFTLSVYDLLIPDDLTGGWRIAGTGTIALDGTVGPIGGVAQKVAGAEWSGAEYFIVPREHEAEARQAARTITLIPVSTAQEAIEALKALPPKPAR